MALTSPDQKALYCRYPIIKRSRQFRVLTLRPAAESLEDQRLHASFETSSLDGENNKFEALSYVWGDSNLPRSIVIVDNVEISIPTNLAAFLLHLRRAEQPLRLWVDALCINQADREEKSDQVALMADIYRSCSQVNVWLPNPTGTTDHQSSGRLLSLGALLTILASKHFHDIPGYYYDEKTDTFSFHETDEFCALWDGFLLLAASAWWTRAWTAQEAYLPPRVIFLHYAAEPCDMDLLIRAQTCEPVLLGNIPPCCVKAVNMFPSQKIVTIRDLFSAVSKILAPRDLRLQARVRDGRDYFYITVAAFADRKSHNARDRLYSLWSTTGDSYKTLRPDYESSEEEVFKSIFTSMLQESQSHRNIKFSYAMDFRVLQGLNFGPSLTNISQKPSWVPDFSRTWNPQVVRAHLDRLAISRKYYASGWSRGHVKVKGAQLHLKGFFIDRIHAIGPAVRNLYDPSSLKDTFSQWDYMIQAFEATQNITGSVRIQLVETFSGGVCKELVSKAQQALLKRDFILRNIAKANIVRLMIECGFQNMVWEEQWRPLQPDDYPEQAELDDLFKTGDINCIKYEGYRNAVVSCLLYRSLLITDSGRIGLSVDHARAGDQIWGVNGSKVPFVFRQCNCENELVTCNLVGDCYLYGAMEGQLVRKAVKVILI
ncbi:heterokaryon incompatibility protein-domain-containing protein [Xylaria flabelliformis]|nr:heterokaryon incompatibility protein-domain-containing protein [Xylaria flabelliformis]